MTVVFKSPEFKTFISPEVLHFLPFLLSCNSSRKRNQTTEKKKKKKKKQVSKRNTLISIIIFNTHSEK